MLGDSFSNGRKLFQTSTTLTSLKLLVTSAQGLGHYAGDRFACILSDGQGQTMGFGVFHIECHP